MSPDDAVFQKSLIQLLREVFQGTGQDGFILNPNDPGLLGQLESLTASQASTRPTAGKTTIAAHVDHVLYGLTLLNRWAAGEANPWASANWEESWKRQGVDEAKWRDLRDRLRQAAQAWQRAVEERQAWDAMAASGALASVAHTAYHLGAIRQLIAAGGFGKK
jgi:hypothetical protein